MKGEAEQLFQRGKIFTFSSLCSNSPLWRPGVNFTNILQAAFMPADLKSAKKTVKLSSFIALLGSACVKAARRMLVKLTQSFRCFEDREIEANAKIEFLGSKQNTSEGRRFKTHPTRCN